MKPYNRPTPGTLEIEGREFLYIESPLEEDYGQMGDLAFSVSKDTPLPSSGGALEEGVRIHLGDGTSFIGLSYKGDIEGWRTKFITFCKRTGRAYASIKNNQFVVSTGATFPLKELEIDIQKP